MKQANSGSFTKGVSGNEKGRPKGIPNKTTQDVRVAIATLLETSSPKFQQWLDQVATGKISDGKDEVEFAKPDPGRALDLIAKLSEYHIPKLARTEVSGTPGGAPVRLIIGG